MVREAQTSRLNHITKLAALSLATIHNLMLLISPLRNCIQYSNTNENYGNLPNIFGSRLMFIVIYAIIFIRIKLSELQPNMALKDGFTLSTIAAVKSMTETGTRTIPLAKGLGHLMK